MEEAGTLKRDQGWGDAWTWVAMDPGSKLVITFRLGPRDVREAQAFMHDLAARLYNSCRVHKTLGTTPAVAAGVVLNRWTIDDLVALLGEAERAMPQKRRPYKKRAA